MTLSGAKNHKIYVIKKIGGDTLLHRRLLDMGITLGTKVYIAATAKSAVLIGIRGIFIALRNDAADIIVVEPLSNP